MVQELLFHLASIDAAAADGKTALHLAAERGHAAVVECLLAWDADINLWDAQGATPLSRAAQHQHAAVLQQLAKHVASKMDSSAFPHQAAAWQKIWGPLHKAAEAGDCVVIQALLDAGVPVEFPGSLARDDGAVSSGVTSLMVAAHTMGHVAAARLLLARGAVAGAQDSRGLTPVRWAVDKKPGPCMSGRIAVLDMLVAAGAPIDAVTPLSSCTALVYAIDYGNDCLVQHLLHKWPSTAAARKQQEAAWCFAAKRGRVSMLSLFGTLHVNSHNVRGLTALHCSGYRT